MVALATEFADLAAEIRGAGTLNGRWGRIGKLGVAHVPGCTWASITDVQGGHGRSLAASDPIAAYLDKLQFDAGEGPCLHSAEAGATVVCPDLAAEQRWPEFVRLARERTSLRGVLAIRLPGR